MGSAQSWAWSRHMMLPVLLRRQLLKAKQRFDLYSSCEPQKALHKRIAFCLQMHNDAVKAMAYPDSEAKDGDDPEQRREREKQQLANVPEDDDDDMGMI